MGTPRHRSPMADICRSLRFSPIAEPSPALTMVRTSPRLSATTPVRARYPPASPTSAPRSRSKAGRRSDKIWDHFVSVREGVSRHARCKACHSLIKNGKPSGNLKVHLARFCKKVAPDVRAEYLDAPPQNKQPNEEAQSNTDQASFEMALAMMVFACSLPFVIVESKAFRDFISLVCPKMRLPSRQRLSAVLLPEAKLRMRNEVINIINRHRYVSVVTDGWTDRNGASILNFMVVAPGMPSLFWCSFSTYSDQHTAENLSREFERVIDEIQSSTTAVVTGIVTDNAANMLKATGSIVTRRPHIVSGGCAAHVLNLLMRDVCQHPIIEAVYERSVYITRFIRDHLALFDEFKKLQDGVRKRGGRAVGLVLPMPTRWYSAHACLQSVSSSRDVIEELCLSHHYATFRERYKGSVAKKLETLVGIVQDHNFWQNLAGVIRLTEPIVNAIAKLEADSTYLSGVYACFRDLKYHSVYQSDGDEAISSVSRHALQTILSQHIQQEHSDDKELATNMAPYNRRQLVSSFRLKIQKRWEYVHTSAMGVAFYMDPSTSLDDFIGNDKENARMQACELAQRCGIIRDHEAEADLMAEVYAFADVKREGGERMRHRLSKTSPKTYWSDARDRFPCMAKLAEVVFSIPTSSAASERAWSIFEHIHTKRRNRLSIANVEALAFVYINFGTTSNGDLDLALHQAYPECVDSS